MIRVKLFIKFIVVGLLIACAPAEQHAEGYHLVYVQDGDSAVLCCDDSSKKGGKFTVRLLDIDTPEKGQPYAEQSKEQLQRLLEDKSLVLLGAKYDKYGRRLTVIEANGENVNDVMVETGAAWVWRYSKSRRMKAMQQTAKDQQRGLWALPEAERQDPWLWRQQHKR